MANIYKFEQLASTNDTAQDSRYSHGDIIWAIAQEKGRGQRGNKWDSASGENLTCSLVLTPEHLEACNQFYLLEIVALAVVDTLACYGIEAKVKWTNDVYVKDKKICGILIDNSVCGNMLSRSVVGIGLNINQSEFQSWVPNPTSLKLLINKDLDIKEVLDKLYKSLAERYSQLESGENEQIHQEYLSKLYLLNENHRYTLPSGESFEGQIIDVATNGELKIEDSCGSVRGFMFKEISF